MDFTKTKNMRLTPLLENLRDNEIITKEQFTAISEISSGKRFSVYWELQALLYFGVICLVTGIGFTIKKYFYQLGDIAVISSLSISFFSAFVYCFLKSGKYSNEEVKPPNIAFDYILLLACLLFSMDLAYIETHFHILNALWKNYLLFSALVFMFLAYRFDNRMVLSLGISALASWFGFKTFDLFANNFDAYRVNAVIYGLIVLSAGAVTYKYSIKKHFLDIFLNFALNFLFIAVVSGVFEYKIFSLYFLGLVMLSIISIIYAFNSKRLVYMIYAIIYGYIGFSSIVMDMMHSDGFKFLYFIFSSISVVIMIFIMSRKFKE